MAKIYDIYPGNSIQAFLQEAASLSEPVTLRIFPGIYQEKLTLEIPHLTLLGMGKHPEDTVISFGDYGKYMLPGGEKLGTFRSYTLFVNAAHITLKNLTVENTASPRCEVGQAVALYADDDDFHAVSCRLLGNQDTLFTGPLPEKEYEPGGFRGPKEFAPRTPTAQYYEDCYICGDIDFIFGSAAAFFRDCTLHSKNNGTITAEGSSPTCGYVTAASTPAGQTYGYVFYQCRLTSDCPPDSVYLGRPWRNYANTVFIACQLGAHIKKEGFHDWDKKAAHETMQYMLIDCVGHTIDQNSHSNLAPFVKIGTHSDFAFYTRPFKREAEI